MIFKDIVESQQESDLSGDGTKTFSDILDEGGEKNEADLRIEILQFALDNANSIYKLSSKEESSKAKWRTFFILFFSGLLFITVTCTLVLLVVDAMGLVSVSTALVIGIFTSIVAEIFSILHFTLKYINNTQYLESFSTISHKLLDYLVQDKASGNISIQ